ncbi:MAG TPA: hypothetical protein VMG08_06405 [Allosphingosinicella sp.]|nr:hypothetical protein [Allosphingosinicella sp.]
MNTHRDRRQVPPFTPVPLRYRADGWTPVRQAVFLGILVETRCVAAAARAVGMGRESAYRLRERPGAESFAAAWDRVLETPRESRMSTHDLLWHRLEYGKIRPIMKRGKCVAVRASPDNDAVLRLYRMEMRRRRTLRRLAGRDG